MATIAQILGKKWPGNTWTVGQTYESLVWSESNTDPKPTSGSIAAYDAEVTTELKWDSVRKERDRYLTACDWTQLADSPLSASAKTEWATYRQELRDVPQDQLDPDNISWPSTP